MTALVLADTTTPAANLKQYVEKWQAELDSYYATMQEFASMEPDEIFVSLSGFSARAGEIRTNLVRNESRLFGNFRIKEIDPFITEVDRQFKIWSRCLTTRELDYRLAGKIT